MSAYERERAEHIARNKERMAALQLPSLAHNVAPKKEARPAKQRGISSKSHKAPVSSAPDVTTVAVTLDMTLSCCPDLLPGNAHHRTTSKHCSSSSVTWPHANNLNAIDKSFW